MTRDRSADLSTYAAVLEDLLAAETRKVAQLEAVLRDREREALEAAQDRTEAGAVNDYAAAQRENPA